jgi:hypothetical protein
MPVTNDELLRAAYNLTGAIIAMYRADGWDPDRIGETDARDVDVIGTTIEDDAELFMSMDPERLEEEYNEIRAAGRFTVHEADPTGVIGRLHKELEPNWAGNAADAFSVQLSKITSCITVQHEYTTLAAQAVGMMFAVTTQFRASCRDLMEQTAQTCDSVAAGSGNPGRNWLETGVGLVRSLIDTITKSDPAALANWTLDQFVGEVGDALANTPVPGDKAGPVAEGYFAARERLFSSYEDNLEQIRAWISARREDLASLGETIPDPLPASADVDSPDFRYENFHHPDHVPADYAPEVERERQRYVEEKTKPDGVIAERLAGER